MVMKKYPRIKDSKINTKFIISAIIIIFVFLFLLGNLINIPEISKNKESSEITEKNSEQTFFSSAQGTFISMYLPAVDAQGNGVNTLLTVEATPGTGRTLTDIDNLLFWADTQQSIRAARKVAENITGKKTENYDIVYTIKANASLIGGPSAGAALALATIAALKGEKLNNEVMITGSINHDGSIGPVTAILEKAKAAKSNGAALFLVPLLQSRDVIYETSEHCETFGQSEICTSETKPRKVDVSAEAGIQVREVETVQEAMGYFFN